MGRQELETPRQNTITSISALLSDPHALTILRQIRQEQSQTILLNEHPKARQIIESVYEAFEAPAINMLMPHLGKFQLSQEDIKDHQNRQRVLLWTSLTKFDWDRYPSNPDGASHAVGALMTYLKTSTGLGDVDDLINTPTNNKSPKRTISPPKRPVEERVVGKQARMELTGILESWTENLPETAARALELQVAGHSIKEICQILDRAPSTIKHNISAARRSLYAELNRLNLVSIDEVSLHKDTRIGDLDRDALLAIRRNIVVGRYSRMQDLLPPRVAEVIDIYFGVSSGEPVYDIEKVAEICATTPQNVTMCTSLGYRILSGVTSPSERAVVLQTQKGLYDSWRRSGENTLDKQMVTVLKLYLEDKLTYCEIAEKLGVSASTAQRIYQRGLNLIKARSSSL